VIFCVFINLNHIDFLHFSLNIKSRGGNPSIIRHKLTLKKISGIRLEHIFTGHWLKKGI